MDFLLVTRGNDNGSRFELTGSSVIVGRGQGCAIRLKDPEVSRRHIELRKEGDFWNLIDLNSSNGVYLNGTRVTEKLIALGDQIQVGRTLFRFSSDAADESRRMPDDQIVNFSAAEEEEPSQIIHSYKEDASSSLFSQSAELTSGIHHWGKSERDHLNLIYHTIFAISQTLDIDRLLNRVLEIVFDWVQIDRGCICLCDPETGKLNPKVVKRKVDTEGPMKINSSITNYVLTSKEGILTTQSSSSNFAQDMAGQGIREAICVPMLGRYGLVGIFYIDIVSETGQTAHKAESANSASGVTSPPVPVGEKEWEPGRPHHHVYLKREHLKLMFAIAHQTALAIEDTQYYSAMLQSERLAAVGQTVAVLSHHIKNILQGIQGGSYLIEKGLSAHDETMVGKGWNIVEKNQGRISDLILDMLTFSKERQPVFELSDLNSIVLEVQELMEGRAADFDIDLIVRLDDAVPKFYFDPEQIHRAVTNLVSNAIDALWNARNRDSERPDSPKGLVRMATLWNAEEKLVRLIVDDNGPGIPEEVRSELFRPFFSKNKSGGTGLGLAVTHKIVQEHKGTISVSVSPEKGARFVIDLPYIDKAPDED